MKVVIIHGQSPKGSTYPHCSYVGSKKISEDIKEFFSSKRF